MEVCPGTELGEELHLCFLGPTTGPQGRAGGGCAPMSSPIAERQESASWGLLQRAGML